MGCAGLEEAELNPRVALERQQVEVRIGRQRRVVIPAALREALALREGDRLVARVDGSRLILERRSAALQRLRDHSRQIPSEVLLSESLIADRRAEAAREELE
jgi:AbrB family looped-hinge helix DNA binding protein